MLRFRELFAITRKGRWAAGTIGLLLVAGCAPSQSGTDAASPQGQTSQPADEEAATSEDGSVGASDCEAEGDLQLAKFGVFPALVSVTEVVAADQCIWQEHGIQPELGFVASAPQLMQGMLADEYDFVVSPPGSLYPSIENGACAVGVTTIQQNQYNIIAGESLDVPPLDSSLSERLSVLEGSTFGVSARGGAWEAILPKLMTDAGLDADSVTYVAIGAGGEAVTAFNTGAVDAMASFPPLESLIGQENFTYLAKFIGGPDEDKALEDLVNAFLVTSCKNVEEDPELVTAVCQAFAQSQRFMADPANADAVVNSIVDAQMAADQDQAQSIWERYSGTFPDGEQQEITADVWDQQVTYMPTDFVPPYEQHVFQGCEVE